MSFQWNGDRIAEEVNRLAGKGALAAAEYTADCCREILSVQAPTRLTTSRSGITRYIATTPATPGAPPRRVSGDLQSSVVVAEVGDNEYAVFAELDYGEYLERPRMNHPWLTRVLEERAGDIATITGKAAEAEPAAPVATGWGAKVVSSVMKAVRAVLGRAAL